MRIIQYFLIGLFLSLFTIPAFSCPPPFVLDETGLSCSYLDFTAVMRTDVWDGAIEGNINPDSAFGNFLLSKTTVYKPLGTSYIEFFLSTKDGVQRKLDVNFVDSSGNVLIDEIEGDPYGVLTLLSSGWDYFLDEAYLRPIADPSTGGGGGGSVNTPSALFNIDGIKENIFSTLLAIVGVLLGLVSLKYAWSCFSNIFKEGTSSNAGRVSSDEVTYERVGQSNFYRQTHWVDGKDVAHTYDKAGAEGSYYVVQSSK